MDATDRLILYCAKANLEDNSYHALRQLPLDSVDWDHFVQDICKHGLLPLAYQILKGIPESKQLPTRIREQLEYGYRQAIAKNMLLSHELEIILEQCHCQNLPVMVLKGPYLTGKIYSRKDIRPFCDIDLLVKEQDVARANFLLSKLGYQTCSEKPRFWWEEPYPELVLVKQSSGSLCEVHWNFLDKRRFLSINDELNKTVWEEASETQLFGQPVLSMTPEHMLIHLCLHLAIIHRFDRLILYRDIAEILKFSDTDFNWSNFVDCVNVWQVKSQVYYPLCFAKEELGAKIPESALSEIRPRYLSAILFEALFRRRSLASLRQFTPVDALFSVLRDGRTERYKSALGLPYRVIRWHLKGNTC